MISLDSTIVLIHPLPVGITPFWLPPKFCLWSNSCHSQQDNQLLHIVKVLLLLGVATRLCAVPSSLWSHHLLNFCSYYVTGCFKLVMFNCLPLHQFFAAYFYHGWKIRCPPFGAYRESRWWVICVIFQWSVVPTSNVAEFLFWCQLEWFWLWGKCWYFRGMILGDSIEGWFLVRGEIIGLWLSCILCAQYTGLQLLIRKNFCVCMGKCN